MRRALGGQDQEGTPDGGGGGPCLGDRGWGGAEHDGGHRGGGWTPTGGDADGAGTAEGGSVVGDTDRGEH